MKTNWNYIAAYKEEVDALVAQQLEDLEPETEAQPMTEKLKHTFIIYTSLSESYLTQVVAARA